MEASQLSTIMDRVIPGSRLRLTFTRGQGKKQIIDDRMRAVLCYFGLMKNQNLIFPNETQSIMIQVVLKSGYWDSDQNRTFDVVVPEVFDREWFEQRLRDGLETVKIL